ncbi:MAG TPA: hypothetical protein VHY22_07240, partial [Chthoniobacteraceae bacterium]|nr:hypothetical protein [Chthoniobacteraceae bacterium]
MKTKRLQTVTVKTFLPIMLAMSGLLAGSGLHAQIYVAGIGGAESTALEEYDRSGNLLNSTTLSFTEMGGSMALAGTDLFAIDGYTSAIAEISVAIPGTIGVINNSFIPVSDVSNGADGGIVASGTDLFVLTGGGIGEYTTSGQTVNASLVTDVNSPFSIAISGSDIFVLNWDNGITSVGEYTTSGQTVNASLITGLGDVQGIAISGTNLYVGQTGLD